MITETKLPEYINVMQVITYSVQHIVETLSENNMDDENYVPTIEDIKDYIYELALEDFNSINDPVDFIMQDQDGEAV